MKQLVISAVLGLMLLPVLTLEASAAQKSDKDAGIDACIKWCIDHRTGTEEAKCEDNCWCYYKKRYCEAQPGTGARTQPGGAPPIYEPPTDPGPLAPHQYQQLRQLQQLRSRGVEPESPVTAPTEQEEKATPAESGQVQTRSANRGGANTTTRANWCLDHLLNCYSAGNDYCNQHYTGASLKICNDSVTESCGHSWGYQSTCMTDARISVLDTGVILQPGLAAPSSNQPPAPLSPQQMMPKVGPGMIRPRGVEGEPPTSAPTEREEKAPASK